MGKNELEIVCFCIMSRVGQYDVKYPFGDECVLFIIYTVILIYSNNPLTFSNFIWYFGLDLFSKNK